MKYSSPFNLIKMKAVIFRKLIDKLSIEYKWVGDDVIIFVNRWNVEDFIKEIDFTPDNGFDCKIKDGYLVMKAGQICDCMGIELEDVFDK